MKNRYQPQFIHYLNNRNLLAATGSKDAGELGTEGLHFISEDESPNGIPLLITAI